MKDFKLEKYNDVYKLVEKADGFREAIVFLTAVKMELFTVLFEEHMTAEDIAQKLDLDLRATRVFLNSLSSMNFLKKQKDIYKNSYYSNQYLVKGKNYYVGELLKNIFDQIPLWLKLEDVLKTGKPVVSVKSKRTLEERINYVMGMSQFGLFSAYRMLDLLDFEGVKKMLDIGSGAGTYSITFCKHHEDLQCTVIDLPEIIEIANNFVKEFCAEDRVKTIPGDFFTVDFGNDYDLVLISNVFHYYGLDEDNVLLNKAYNALNKGGRIIIKDYLLDESKTSPQRLTMFSIGMIVRTEHGECYTFREIEPLLEKAGFRDLDYLEISPQSKMIVGYK